MNIDVWAYFQQAHSMDLLRKIAEYPGRTIESIAPGDKTYRRRLLEAVDLGLVEIDDDPRQFNSKELYLTPIGVLAVDLIEALGHLPIK